MNISNGKTGRAQKIRADLPEAEVKQLKLIGGRINKLRREMNITTKDMARFINVMESTYREMEEGKRRLSIYNITVIAGMLGQPITYFLGKAARRKGDRVESFEFLNADTLELSRNFVKIDNLALQATIKLLVQIVVESWEFKKN